jgi:hypothetical protein
MDEWLRLALSPSVALRATKYSLVVGAVLITINHSDVLFAGAVPSAARLLRMGLTLIVPYVVSTLSSVGALRQNARTPPR